MPLPFPHGDGPGQIANGHNYDVNDTPGYAGGRFIGFGEFATSAITNRASWALSSNIDYIYQNYTAWKAIPAAHSFTAGSGGANSITITDYVFTGDSSYPATLAEGMMLLFAVLNEQYNALTDAAGNEVRISDIIKTGASVYRDGDFQQSVDLPFCTVNPVTGAVVSVSYTIPEGTIVRVMYPSRSSLEALPIDVFTRFNVMSSEEVPAGVLLLDGSLPMAGNLDMADIASGNSLTIDVGVGGTTITTHVSGVGDATLVSDPNSGVGLSSLESFDLGSATSPWGTLWVYNVHLLGNLLPLLSNDDYYFKADFANPRNNTLPGTPDVDTWLQLNGTAGSTMSYVSDFVYGRVTVKLLSIASSSEVSLDGPVLSDLQGDLIHALVGFSITTLPDAAGENYTLRFGFNVTGATASLQAFIQVYDEGVGYGAHMYLICGDGIDGHFEDLGPVSAQTWYDVHMAFGAGNISVYVNGELIGAAVACILPAQTSPGYAFTALRLEHTAGSAGATALIDYVTLYSQGHQPRPYTS